MAKLVKKIGVYFISNILNAAIPFLLLPILTRKLSPSEYGEIAMFQTMVSALIAFVGLNAVGAANRKFYEDHSSDELKEYNGSCLQILLGSSIIVFFVFFIFSSQLVAYLSIPIGWIYSALLFSFLSFIINLRLGQWQIRGEAVKFGCLQISNSLFNMVGSLLLVVVLNYGAQGRIDAQIIAAGLAAASAAYFLIKDKLIILRCWRSDYIRDALYFGVPLVPHVLGFFLLSSVDRFIINEKFGLRDAGIYMVAVQLSMILNIIFDAINKAYVPWLFDILKRDVKKEKEKIKRYTYIYFLILLLLAPIPFFIGPWFLVFLSGDKYHAAGEIIGWLCLGQIFGGMYSIVTNYIFYAGKTAGLSLITILSGGFNFILLIFLTDILGMIGAAIAFSISKLVQFLLVFAYKKKIMI